MTRLNVSVNKTTTFCNARDGDTPSAVPAARRCREFGAGGTTVHPRSDEWHVTCQDVRDLREVVITEFNIEGYPSDPFLDLIHSVRPEQVTLVPDKPDALISDSGRAVADRRDLLKSVAGRLKQVGICILPFVGTDSRHTGVAAGVGADRVEMYTGPYMSQMAQSSDPRVIVVPFAEAIRVAQRVDLGISVGHDLNRDNLIYLVQYMTPLDEVSIGYALISDVPYLGLEEIIVQYLKQAHPDS